MEQLRLFDRDYYRKITFNIPARVKVEVSIYDGMGIEQTQLVNRELKPGVYEVIWNTRSIPEGVYYCRVEAGEFSNQTKMIVPN